MTSSVRPNINEKADFLQKWNMHEDETYCGLGASVRCECEYVVDVRCVRGV